MTSFVRLLGLVAGIYPCVGNIVVVCLKFFSLTSTERTSKKFFDQYYVVQEIFKQTEYLYYPSSKLVESVPKF